jgi:hypothetical protein
MGRAHGGHGSMQKQYRLIGPNTVMIRNNISLRAQIYRSFRNLFSPGMRIDQAPAIFPFGCKRAMHIRIVGVNGIA